jgi:glycerol uptake facilitator-like aquaporin
MVVFRKMPLLKAGRYILAQIFGSFVAVLFVYAQYHDIIQLVEAELQAKGAYDLVQFTPSGPAGILALYVAPGTNLSRVFLNEFITDTVLALAIWGSLDPTNFLAPPAAVPWIISFAYGMAIWGYATPGLAANSARDLGGRLAAIAIYGKVAWGGNYAAIAALTNIVGMLVGVCIYEFILTDSARVLSRGHVEFIEGHRKHAELRDEGKRDGVVENNGHHGAVTSSSMEKGDGGVVERMNSKV